jgi:integrase
MATIKFLLQSKRDTASIYIRFSIDRKNVYKRKTNYVVNPSNWSAKKGMPKSDDEESKNLKTDLEKLSTSIGERYNKAIKNGITVNGDWLTQQINEIQNRKTDEELDLSILVNYFQFFIDNLQNKRDNEKGVTLSTVQKYTTIKNKILDFQNHKKKVFFIKDVDLLFRNEFIKYLKEVDKLSENTIGRYITFLRTVLLNALENEQETSKQLSKIKGYKTKVEKVYLTFEEIEKINQETFTREALNNAKDWLIIGCYIGQRVSDFLKLTKDNIKIRNGVELIELTQKKTGKIVSIPLHDEVKTILDKRNGEFPTQISAVKFNLHIKDICKLSGINQIVEGGKIDEIEKDINRKVYGKYPKWELITSHVCRRSFATNFYGDIPTALLISVTGHSTEKQFLEYIGKNPTDYATQLADYWSKQSLIAKKEPILNVVKKQIS